MKKTISPTLVLTLCMVTKADFLFRNPNQLGPEINTSNAEISPSISSDGLSLYFSSMRGDGFGGFDLWVSSRQGINDNWGPAVNLGSTINSSAFETNPSISFDGLSLFFSDSIPGFTSQRSGGLGQGDLWYSTRTSKYDAWEPAQNLGPPVNTSFREEAPYISSDGLSLFFSSDRDNGQGKLDIWVTTRKTKHDPWEEPVNMGLPINSPDHDDYICLSADSLFLLLASTRPPSRYWDLWISTRNTQSAPWEPLVILKETINTDIQDFSVTIMPDGSAFYFASRP
jgi:hypothetical protein